MHCFLALIPSSVLSTVFAGVTDWAEGPAKLPGLGCCEIDQLLNAVLRGLEDIWGNCGIFLPSLQHSKELKEPRDQLQSRAQEEQELQPGHLCHGSAARQTLRDMLTALRGQVFFSTPCWCVLPSAQ